MTYNLQYKFKPKEMTPGFKEGQEMCVCKGLTEYAKDLEVPLFALQLWEGKNEDSHVVGYALVDIKTKQVIFVDHRYDVCEYTIEQIRIKIDEQNNSEPEAVESTE